MPPTVREIAESAGVSPATVSRSLRNPTVVRKDVRDRVLAEAVRMGYEVNVRKRKRTGMIGLLYYNASSGLTFGGYDAVIWGGVSRAAMGLNYGVNLIDPTKRESGESFGAFANRMGVDGFVIRVDQETRDVCREIASESIPHVIVADRFDPADGVNFVCCDSYDASYAAVSHLLALGHQRIAICHNTVMDTDHQDRVRAYHTALNDASIPIDPSLVCPLAANIRGGASAINLLTAMPEPPTAIFLTDPPMTVGAIRRCQELGIHLPQQLSIVGVDDEDMREMTYPVYTAICQPANQIGFQATRWLCQSLIDPRSRSTDRSLQVKLEAVLDVNQSTAPPPTTPFRLT